MTLNEFHDFLMRGGSVKCYTSQQRNTVAEFIRDELGFRIGDGTLNYMSSRPNGTDYMIVELFDRSDCKVVSFCTNALGSITTFDSISNLIESRTSIDTRSKQEFSDAFAELMS